MSHMGTTLLLLLVAIFPIIVRADVPASEFHVRREQLMRHLPDGIVLLHARSDLISSSQMYSFAFQQERSFYYFTGLESTLGAILAIDGPARESWLFVPPTLSGPAGSLEQAFVRPQFAKHLLIDHVVEWSEFVPYISRRVAQNPAPVLYVDDTGNWIFQEMPESNPPGLAPIEHPSELWKRALQARWPSAQISSASAIIASMRLVKTKAEIEVMRRVAKVSSAAVLAGLGAIQPGRSQREIEAEVIRECVRAGGEGPSFWPWILTGPVTALPNTLELVTDYHRKNRIMQATELGLVDIGCEVEHYGGDVGRTAPVSGRFSAEQREVWELLTRAFRAGLAAFRDGVTREKIISASIGEAKRLQSSLKTALAHKAILRLLGKEADQDWLLHGTGLECCERALTSETLRSGMIVAFEVRLPVDDQAFYLEDMLLITDSGHEVLTTGLPYSAEEIEAAMAKYKNRSRIVNGAQ